MLWISAALLAGGLGTVSCFRSDSPGRSVVATVNNEPVTVPEFRFFMNQHTSEVYGYFSKTYDARDHEHFWNTRFGSEIPIEKIKQMTLRTCVSVKIQQILAKEKGILENVTFDSFLEDFRRENACRKQAVENRQIVYGPIEYTLQTCMNRRMSLLEIQLIEILAKEPSGPSDTAERRYQALIRQRIRDARIKVNRSVYNSLKVRFNA